MSQKKTTTTKELHRSGSSDLPEEEMIEKIKKYGWETEGNEGGAKKFSEVEARPMHLTPMGDSDTPKTTGDKPKKRVRDLSNAITPSNKNINFEPDGSYDLCLYCISTLYLCCAALKYLLI